MDTPDRQDATRRGFFTSLVRSAAAGGLVLAGVFLTARRQSPLNEASCINRGICRGCGAFDGCGLPQALSARRAQEKS